MGLKAAQVHLSVGGPGSVLVMWATGKAKVNTLSSARLMLCLVHERLLPEHLICWTFPWKLLASKAPSEGVRCHALTPLVRHMRGMSRAQ